MAITQETLRVVEQVRRQLLARTDAQTLALTRAWVEAWDTLLPEFETAVNGLVAGADGVMPLYKVARSRQLQGALQATRAVLEELAPRAGILVASDAEQALYDALSAHRELITTQLPPGTLAVNVGFDRVADEQLAAIVERTTQQIHSSYKPLPADVERAMKRELLRGIAVGANPRETARRIIKKTESRFNGGLSRALNIARTETLDAHRAATRASELANRDLLMEWEWHASLDARTCPSCLAQHGSRHDLEEDGPLDHQQGRCARVSVTKSWKALGFDIEEPPSLTPSSQEWFNSLTPGTQREIMGPARLKLLQDGTIQWSDLSRRGTNPGWRDSYNVPPVKNLTK